MEICSHVEFGIFSWVTSDGTTRNDLKLHQGGLDWILREISSQEVLSRIVKYSRGNCEVTLPGNVKKNPGVAVSDIA